MTSIQIQFILRLRQKTLFYLILSVDIDLTNFICKILFDRNFENDECIIKTISVK